MGLTVFMIGTTGEHHAYFVLDDELRPVPAPLPDDLRLSVERITENCEPALTSVVFIAGGRLAAGRRHGEPRGPDPRGSSDDHEGHVRRRPR